MKTTSLTTSIGRALALGVTAAFLSTQAQAGPITIQNANFDTLYKPGSTTITATLPTSSWTYAGGNSVAGITHTVQNGGIATYSDTTTGNLVDYPAGWDFIADSGSGIQKQAASLYTNTSWTPSNTMWTNAPRTVSQTLTGVSLLSDTTYTLSMDIGKSSTSALTSGMVVFNLMAGSTTLTPTSVVQPSLLDSGWVTWTQTYVITTPINSNDLVIQLGTIGNSNLSQGNFDNVSLSAVAVPEPATSALLVGGLAATVIAFRRRRQG